MASTNVIHYIDATNTLPANSGIGLELAAQLMQKHGYHVLVCSRSIAKGEAAVKGLQSRSLPSTCELLQLDQTDDESIARAVKDVETAHGRIDALVNNAAIADSNKETREWMLQSFDTNVAGPALVTKAFVPLLKKSTSTPRIVNVSSGAGSINMRLDASLPYYKMRATVYRMTKSALNMLSACMIEEYGAEGIKVLVYCPGFTESNLGPHNKAEFGAAPVGDAVRPLLEIVEGRKDDQVGVFMNRDEIFPW